MNDRFYRRIVDEVTDLAILVLDRVGTITSWNAGAEAIFGYAPDDVLGKHFELLFTPDDRDRDVPKAELERAQSLGRTDDVRWHLRSDGRLVFLDGSTTALRNDGELVGFAKFARDLTERQRTEQRLAAQLSLTNVLNEEQPFEPTARRIMQTICENLKWEIGALWEVAGDTIRCVQQWHAPMVDPVAVKELCEGQSMKRGVGLIGRAWESREAVWVTEWNRAIYPRAEIAERAGMRAAFAFPITRGGRVTGAMEFFSATTREPDPTMMPVMTLIGAQIGDFIDRRRTAEILRESEERYRVVSETAQDAIFTMDERSMLLFCNAAVERMFGWKPEELTGQSIAVIIPERLREQHHAGIARFLRTRERHIPWTGVEFPALHRDGSEFPCEFSFGAWEAEDGATIFTGFARDVTERKRALELEQQARADAEAAREQLERRAEEESSFRRLASALTGAVEMVDVLTEITSRATLVTRADGVYVERIVTVGDAQLVEVVSAAGRGAPPRNLRVAYPGSMTDEILKNGVPVILADMTAFGRSMAPYLVDSCKECEVLVTPLVAEEESLGALVLLNSATSGRRFRDGDIVRARTLGDLASLALRRVRLMEQEREAKEKAEAAVRVRDETLGIVSHDLRNPLTKIALSAELLPVVDPPEQRDLIDTILSSAKQMQRLIQDLLDVARVESGRLSVAPDVIDAADLVREICASNGALAEQKRQRITCTVPDSLPKICADRDRLVQVFGNLISNAMKFTPERGTIAVEARRVNQAVQFIVRDSGPGIPESDLRHVFTPYWQAKKTAHMGAGLGLAIVRGIVEAHGGRMWAENASSGGAVFRFTIPIAP